MGLLDGRKGLILGVANDHSIAWLIARALRAEGAELGFSYLPMPGGASRMEARVQALAERVDSRLVVPCDVSKDEEIAALCARVGEGLGRLDFVLHSIAFAPLADIRCTTLDASRAGFSTAMEVSVYSLIAVARAAAPLMREGGAIATVTYYGGEKVVSGYNLMGVCKAALDCAVRYLAHDLGRRGIRVNAISAGPMRTLAASAVGDIDAMRRLHAEVAPLGRNVEAEELGRAAAYLLSDLSSATTGEILHVDCGYSTMGAAAVR
jgi:enoyl-[acyl-carrier protein] reductase I